MPKPHRFHDPNWRAILALKKLEGKLTIDHFQLVNRLGSGDVGTVNLMVLKGSNLKFAVKSLNKQEMLDRNKTNRIRTEDTILSTVDHPFLATLYTSFQSDKHLYFVMEHCAGGELYDLLLRQPNKRFPEKHAKFYAAEVLLALQYLHLMGYIYRDLKPENVLVHGSGHIVLTDFDLSYCASSRPHMLPPSKTSKNAGPILVAEPFALTNSFVGTEEYLSPEVINATGHNSAVDWWELGIFLYELLYGFTPFRGAHREQTFENILHRNLAFPEAPTISPMCRDVLVGLLQRNPARRLGTQGGAEEIKAHPFFDSIQWSLLRWETPPNVPNAPQQQQPASPAKDAGAAGGSASVPKGAVFAME